MKKNIALALVALLIVVIGVLYFSSEKGTTRGTDVMKIGRYYWPGQYWVEVAHDKGFFKDAGLNVELIDSNPDYYGSQGDVVAGKLDTQNFYLYDLMFQVGKGAKISMILSADTSIGAEAIIAREGISTVADLKGKKIGVESGVATDYLLYTLLKQNKIEAGDVTIVNGKSEELPNLFIQGELDAVIVWVPLTTEALKRPGSKSIWDTSKTPGIISAGYVFRKEYIETHPKEIKAFVEVWKRATDFIKENPQEAYAIVAKINNSDPKDVEAYTLINRPQDLDDNLKAFSYSGGFKSLYGQIRLINLYLGSQGIISKDIEATEILEPKFIQESFIGS